VFVGLLQDMSDGGVCVLLDGGEFTRGTSVTLTLSDGLALSTWVCHTTASNDGVRIGLSFAPIEFENCWREGPLGTTCAKDVLSQSLSGVRRAEISPGDMRSA
jgi:hypothetical protein